LKLALADWINRSIFPFSSPNIDSIKVLRRGKVRRSRLFYLRELVGKKARIREKSQY